ncbi:Carboxylesterase 1 [Morus notabilis]|uniref:Carboxylesterase 1 n=1 Tax=Morus notabilis TaxID=981085 RepID=W9S1B3_9ROSA|nr:Carboxylesterase 1 [Morus notabilis]
MDSFGYSGIPVDAQHNMEEGKFLTNEFITHESTNISPSGRTRGHGRNGGGCGEAASASATTSASVATSRRKCKRTSIILGINCSDQYPTIKEKIFAFDIINLNLDNNNISPTKQTYSSQLHNIHTKTQQSLISFSQTSSSSSNHQLSLQCPWIKRHVVNNPIPQSIHTRYSNLKLNDDGTITRLHEYSPETPASSDPTLAPLALSKDTPLNQSKNTVVRLFIPRKALDSSPPSRLPLIVYFHGGGFILYRASSTMYHDYVVNLAAELRAVVASVDYRRVPVHLFRRRTTMPRKLFTGLEPPETTR